MRIRGRRWSSTDKRCGFFTKGGEARPKLPKPSLKKVEVTDDIKDYLAMFERVATQQRWPEGVWYTQLAGLLTGKALAVYVVLNADDSADYWSYPSSV